MSGVPLPCPCKWYQQWESRRSKSWFLHPSLHSEPGEVRDSIQGGMWRHPHAESRKWRSKQFIPFPQDQGQKWEAFIAGNMLLSVSDCVYHDTILMNIWQGLQLVYIIVALLKVKEIHQFTQAEGLATRFYTLQYIVCALHSTVMC